MNCVVEQVGPGLGRRGVPGGARAVGAVHAAEPVELQRVEARALGAEQRRERHARMDEPDGGAVLRRLRIEIVGGEEPARARHALHDEVGLAGDVVAHVRGQEPRIFGVAAGDAGADQDADLLALVEGLLRGPGAEPTASTAPERADVRKMQSFSPASHDVRSPAPQRSDHTRRAASCEETPNPSQRHVAQCSISSRTRNAAEVARHAEIDAVRTALRRSLAKRSFR